MKHMPRIRPSLFGFLLLISSNVFSQTMFPMLLHPAPGVSARIDKQDNDYVLTQPNGQQVTMAEADDADGDFSPSFSEADYNYDGHDDLVISIPVGMVNIEETLYLYHPQSKTYKRFNVPADVIDRQNCQGLWQTTLLPEQQAIQSSCRSGPRWHSDTLRIEPDGSMWLTEQSRNEEEGALWPYFYKPQRTIQYDRNGNILIENVLSPDDGGGPDISWWVPVKRLALYSAPDRNAKSRSYLIQDDQTIMLAFKGKEWMKIAYHSKNGTIERWIWLEDAYGLVNRYDPEKPSADSLRLSPTDYTMDDCKPDDERDACKLPGYYRNLFTLTLGNLGEQKIDLRRAEIHLIFTGQDNQSVAHKLYNLPPITLDPGRATLLDDNPIEQHGNEYYLPDQSSGHPMPLTPFFPPGLAPGTYDVRVVLTDPSLKGPTYSTDTSRFDYPPQLDARLINP